MRYAAATTSLGAVIAVLARALAAQWLTMAMQKPS